MTDCYDVARGAGLSVSVPGHRPVDGHTGGEIAVGGSNDTVIMSCADEAERVAVLLRLGRQAAEGAGTRLLCDASPQELLVRLMKLIG